MMQSIKIRSQVGADGVLKLEIPLGLAETDLEVMVVFQPISAISEVEQLGWPANFFESTFGSFRDEPLVRESEGNCEIRDELK